MAHRLKQAFFNVRVALAFIAGFLGLLLVWVAIDMPIKAGEAADHAQRMSDLPTVHSGRIGSSVIVSGTIANETPLLRGDFVAYRRQQTQGAYRTGTKTVTVDGAKQPLVIDTSGGRIQIVNNDYLFGDTHVDWAAAQALDTPAGLTEGAITILGFQRSSPVVAVGTVTGEGDVVSVKAEFLVAGPRKTYLEKLGTASESRFGTVLAIASIAALLLLYAFWEGRRLYRD